MLCVVIFVGKHGCFSKIRRACIEIGRDMLTGKDYFEMTQCFPKQVDVSCERKYLNSLFQNIGNAVMGKNQDQFKESCAENDEQYLIRTD